MGLYGRNDVMSVSVPSSAGGCGVIHSRPVTDGVTVDEWDLERMCIMCAMSLKGDPLWAAMPAEIPETPDEKMIREDAEKRGERQIKKSQEKLSVQQFELSQQQAEMNQHIVAMLMRGSNGGSSPDPDLIAALVAQEVQKALTAIRENVTAHAPEITVPADSGLDLMRLHVRTLSKMCHDRGLDRRGSKAELITRMSAAAAED